MLGYTRNSLCPGIQRTRGRSNSLAFSPLDATLVSCSSDRTMRLWSVLQANTPRETVRLSAEGMWARATRTLESFTYVPRWFRTSVRSCVRGAFEKYPDSKKFLYFRQSDLNKILAPDVFDYCIRILNPKVGTVPRKFEKYLWTTNRPHHFFW